MTLEITYKRSFIDILNDVFVGLPVPVITIYKVTSPSAYTWVLNVDNPFYAAYNYQITIGSNKYTIQSINDTVSNPTITITDPTQTLSAPAIGTFALYPFFFFHGSPIDTANELKDLKAAENKYPMAWLWEEFEEDNNWDISSANDRKVSCKLYFLDQADIKLGPTDNRWDTYIKPMMKFRDYFMAHLQNTLQDFMPWGQSTTDKYKTRFGVYLNNKGVKESLFADNLAGVEMTATFTIRSAAGDFKNCEDA